MSFIMNKMCIEYTYNQYDICKRVTELCEFGDGVVHCEVVIKIHLFSVERGI